MVNKHIVAILFFCCITGCNNGYNSSPVIQSVTFSPELIKAGESCLINCIAFDQDNDILSYMWETVGSISGSGSSIFFTPSACCGLPLIILTVEDGKGGSVDTMITVPFSYE